jgi:hypothetical protein
MMSEPGFVARNPTLLPRCSYKRRARPNNMKALECMKWLNGIYLGSISLMVALFAMG